MLASEERGIAGGRKRHIAVDVLDGLLWFMPQGSSSGFSKFPVTTGKLTDLLQGSFHGRQMDNSEGNGALCEQEAVIIDDGVKVTKGLWEGIRHIIHPIEVTAEGMERASGQDGGGVTKGQAIFPTPEAPRDTEGSEREDVIAADLEEGKEVRLLKELEQAVSEADKDARTSTEPVSGEDDKEHTEQGNGTAVRELEELDKAGDISKGHGHSAESKLFGAGGFCAMPVNESEGAEKGGGKESEA